MFVFIFVLVAAVLGSAAMAGIIAYFMHRLGKLEAGGADSARLVAEIERLKEQLDATDTTLDKLQERMDFTEKLLGDGSSEDSKND